MNRDKVLKKMIIAVQILSVLMLISVIYIIFNTTDSEPDCNHCRDTYCTLIGCLEES